MSMAGWTPKGKASKIIKAIGKTYKFPKILELRKEAPQQNIKKQNIKNMFIYYHYYILIEKQAKKTKNDRNVHPQYIIIYF